MLHRKDVVTRRTRYELRKAEERAHILAGLVKALDNLDEVIALIRASENRDVAQKGLMANFGLDQIQANAILEMRLERLTRLERDKIVEERQRLLKEIEYLRAVLSSERMVMGIVKKELADVRKSYADERRTRIVEQVDEIKEEELIIEEEVTVLLQTWASSRGCLHRCTAASGEGSSNAIQTRDETGLKVVVATTESRSCLRLKAKRIG